MEVVIVPDAAAVGATAAGAVAALAARTPGAVLGLATGSSPSTLYGELARRVAAGELSLAGCRAFLLDEYVGLPADHPQRYRNVIEAAVVARTDLPTARVQAPDGLAEDLVAAGHAYEHAIAAAGGVDLQVLGVGTDGHIAFNEPGSSLASRTRVKTLTEQTRRDNARFFGGSVEAVPRHCLTQGIGTILEARHVLLLASGEAKAEAVARVVEGPVTARWPGSALQLHPHVTVVVDEASAARLELADYYRETYHHKPKWQEL
ncbi:glucosamine-6-phosphate deaminase [Nocardioides sp. GCM10027113]|uniref:glucosamine-6-phosphate deaminase n=1 Tax=unclassified Nocardioides TaxID=2615069 RepID=UPI0036232C13